jgi:hypothetical protein
MLFQFQIITGPVQVGLDLQQRPARAAQLKPKLGSNRRNFLIESLAFMVGMLLGRESQQRMMKVDGIMLMVDGFRASLGAPTLPKPAGVKPGRLDLPQALPVSLTPEEELIDDLLGEILARGEAHPLDVLFASLEESARGEQWEVKRRVAEALPRLVQLQPQATQRLAERLRRDYHPDYRADIRRRVVEAVPALYRSLGRPALSLLAYRDQDEVYTAMAAVEVLHDLETAGSITADIAEHHFQTLQLEQRPQLDQEVLIFLRQLLAEATEAPDTALASMDQNRSHPERLLWIVIQRGVLPYPYWLRKRNNLYCNISLPKKRGNAVKKTGLVQPCIPTRDKRVQYSLR